MRSSGACCVRHLLADADAESMPRALLDRSKRKHSRRQRSGATSLHRQKLVRRAQPCIFTRLDWAIRLVHMHLCCQYWTLRGAAPCMAPTMNHTRLAERHARKCDAPVLTEPLAVFSHGPSATNHWRQSWARERFGRVKHLTQCHCSPSAIEAVRFGSAGPGGGPMLPSKARSLGVCLRGMAHISTSIQAPSVREIGSRLSARMRIPTFM